MKFFSSIFKKDTTKSQVDGNSLKSENILELVWNLSSFECDENHSIEVQDFDKKIEIIYKNLILSLLNWSFLQKDDYNSISEIIDTLITDFDNKNMENNQTYIKLVKPSLRFLLSDLKLISILKIEINNKRKRVQNIDIIPENIWERKNFMELLHQIIYILILESHIIEWGDWLMMNFASIYGAVDSMKFVDEFFNKLQSLIKERINFNLYKFSLVYWKNRVDYYRNEEVDENIWDIKDDSLFCDIKKILVFLKNPESTSLFIQEKTEKEKLENSKFWDRITLNKLTTYYKGRTYDLQWLEWIIDWYSKNHELTPSPTDEDYINYVYIQNNYLSLLIRTYEKDNHNKNTSEIEWKIDNNFRNYFTYFKYAQYKYLSAKFFKNKDLKKAKQDIKTASKVIEDAINIFYADDFYKYFEYDIESNSFELSNENWDLGKLFICNMYCLPFDGPEKREDLEDLQNKIFRLEVEIINDEKIETVDKKINDYKVDIMTVVWIFTAIVVYSFWTIQIFSIIENIWDTLMFSWIFLSWILLLLFWVFLYKEELKKALLLLWVSVLILTLSIVWRYFLKDQAININKWENTNSKLENSIYKATLLEESLEKLIEESKNNNANKSNS